MDEQCCGNGDQLRVREQAGHDYRHQNGGKRLGGQQLPRWRRIFIAVACFRLIHSERTTVEGQGINPDITVEVHPEELSKGIDRQLEMAVKVLTTAPEGRAQAASFEP